MLETTFAEKVIHQEIEDAIPFELANPDDRELEVREVTNAMSLGLAVVENVPKVAAPAKQLLDEARVDLARLPAYDVPEGLKFDDRLVVKGSTGEQMVQIESALDRVTWEIAQNLQESKLLVVWLLDGSGSLKTQRDAVAKRLRRIYGELGALDNTSTIPRHEKGLLSSVVMFGEKTNFVVKPTDKFEDVQEGIANLPTDSSGVENVFTAVKQTVNLWSSYRSEQHRRIMLITITDEAGDDFGKPHLEAIAICRRYGAKAYVIGPTSPFGQRRIRPVRRSGEWPDVPNSHRPRPGSPDGGKCQPAVLVQWPAVRIPLVRIRTVWIGSIGQRNRRRLFFDKHDDDGWPGPDRQFRRSHAANVRSRL